MPTYKNITCTLHCSGSSKSPVAFANADKITQVSYEHFTETNEKNRTVSCTAEVVSGYFGISLNVDDASSSSSSSTSSSGSQEAGVEWFLVRIIIDGRCRAERLIPNSTTTTNNHFSATEYSSNGTWYTHRWQIRDITLSHLRGPQTRARGPNNKDYIPIWGTIAVKVLRVTKLCELEAGGVNHDVGGEWKKEWEVGQAKIPVDEYRDKGLSHVVCHHEGGREEMGFLGEGLGPEGRGVRFARVHSWEFVQGEGKGRGEGHWARFLFRYRGADTIQTRLKTEMAMPSPVKHSLSDPTPVKVEVEEEPMIPFIKSMSTIPEVIDLDADNQVTNIRSHIQVLSQQLEAAEKRKAFRIRRQRKQELRKQLSDLKANAKVAYEDRYAKEAEVQTIRDSALGWLQDWKKKADDAQKLLLVVKAQNRKSTAEEIAQMARVEAELEDLERQDLDAVRYESPDASSSPIFSTNGCITSERNSVSMGNDSPLFVQRDGDETESDDDDLS